MFVLEELVRHEFPLGDADTSVASSSALLIDNELTIPVFSRKSFVGVTHYTKLLRLGADYGKTKLKTVSVKPTKLTLSSEPDRLFEGFSSSRLGMLPVFKQRRFFGVVYYKDVLKALSRERGLKDVAVADFMEQCGTLNRTDSIAKAVTLMKDQHAYALPVMSDKGKLVGSVDANLVFNHLLSAQDFEKPMRARKSHVASEPRPWDMEVANVLSKRCTSLSPQSSLKNALKVLLDDKYVFVIDGDATFLMGIRQVFRALGSIYSTTILSRNIQIDGMPRLSQADEQKLRTTINTFYDKLTRRIHHIPLLRIHFKQHEVSGLRKKHTVHIHLRSPGLSVDGQATSWSVLTALQQALQATQHAMKKRVAHRRRR
jgi:predicted transcriptional regulator